MSSATCQVPKPDGGSALTCSCLGSSAHRSDQVTHELSKLMASNGYDKQAYNLATCGDSSFWAHCNNCHHTWEVEKTCDLRVCPKCEDSRKGRVVKKYKESVLSNMRPKRVRFVTLTKQNVQHLTASDITELRSDYKKLLRKQLKPDGNSKATFKSKLWGGIYAIEVNYGKNGWNLHLHILSEGYYIDQDRLSEAWEEVSGSPVVDIRKTNNNESTLVDMCKYVAKRPFVRKRTHLVGDCYVYESLTPEEEAKRLFEYFEATYRKHMVQVFGRFFHAREDCDKTITVNVPSAVCPICGSDNIVTERQYYGILDPPPEISEKSQTDKYRDFRHVKSQSGLEVYVSK